MQVPGIYRILLNDGRCYVGQSCNMQRRWREHRSKLRRGLHWLPHLQNCWNKYGEDAFTFEVLEQCALERMTEREQWWMDNLKPAFNVSLRADGGAGYKRPFRNLTPEHRAKIGAAHRARSARLLALRPPKPLRIYHRNAAAKGRPPVSAETRAKLSAANKGRKQSPELIAKRSAALKGRKGHYAGKTLSPEHRARIAASHMGKRHTEAARANMSVGQRRRYQRERAAKAAPQLDLTA